MFYAGRQAQWFARGPWFVAGAGALVLLAGFVTVHRHGHWHDGTSLSTAPDAPAAVAKSASSGATVKSRAAAAPAARQAGVPAKPAYPAVAAAANRQPYPPAATLPAAKLQLASAATATPKPSFDVVRVDVGGEALFAGRGSPGAEITIRDDGRQLGRIKADETGQWVFLSAAPLDPGSRELTLSERTAEGNELKSDASVLLVVPDRAQRQAADPLPALAVLAPDKPAGQGSLRLLQPPPPVGLGPGAHLGLDVVQYDDHGAIRFAGSAPPGAPVRLYVDNHAIGDAVADGTGRWALTPAAATIITVGHHQVRVDELNAKGRVSARVELPFARDIEPDKLPSGGHVVVQPGQNLWVLARQLYGAGHLYMVIYQANRAEIRDPRLIYPGQTFALPESPPAQAPPTPAAAGPPNAG